MTVLFGVWMLLAVSPAHAWLETGFIPVWKTDGTSVSGLSGYAPFETRTNSLGMTFVKIPAGEFFMGSPTDEPGRYDDETRHKVKITKSFWMMTTEVTQNQWEAVMGENPSYFRNCGGECPVERVSWKKVKKFIKKLQKKDRRLTYRLPTEAEWEYAARAGTQTPFSTGDCLSTDQANYDGNHPQRGCKKGIYRGKTVSTASFPPNAWGIHDMHGNVWEWVEDGWKDDYQNFPMEDPIYAGTQDGPRVIRGGGWGFDARYCRLAIRFKFRPGYRDLLLGFRLAGE